jgi:DNA-binding transcriptional ArsR family regulator
MHMPTDQLSATFAALADPTRQAILARLLSGERSVTEFAEPFNMSMPAVSKHLRVLERAGSSHGERRRSGGDAESTRVP